MYHATQGEKRADELVQAGLDHIDQGITIFDRDLRLVGWNRRFLDLLGFPEDLAYAGAPFEIFIRHNAERGEYGPGDPQEQTRFRVERARRFEPHLFERPRPDGRILRVEGVPMTTGGFVTVYTDITNDKSREEVQERLIRDRTRALRLSEERLRLIADNVPAGIAQVDRDMRICFANIRFARAYGLSPTEILGLTCDDILKPETLDFSRPFFDQARRGIPADYEMTVTLPSGRVIDIRTFLRPDRPGEGTPCGFYLLSVDITRLKKATAAALQAQKMEALGQLSSGIAHDFNNLLTVIIGNLVPLCDRLGDTEETRDLARPALAAARRGANFTRRLLAVARRQALQPAAVDVEDAIGQLVKLLRPSLPENVELATRLRGGAKPAFVDPGQLEMALLNLAINARDALRDGGRIELASRHQTLGPAEAEALKLGPGDYVRVSVTDDGPGMDAATAARAFEPFFSTKADGGGSGLGLSMVYGFLRQSGGAVQLDTAPGMGTRFDLFLPALSVPAPAPAEDPGEVPPAGVAPGIALLVEDNSDVRRVIRRQLAELGYPIIEAGSAEEAEETLEAVAGIRLVVTDVAMPGAMDGRDLAARLRAACPGMAVVVMTGHSELIAAADPDMAIPFLQKPFERAALAAAIAAEHARIARLEAVS
ncbi:hybrid sensor histidine kinase/response regulator [Mangrovicoccus algicola]|uniref:histidine kinase n=1 Tax=Mangrovicoccus algicola TaxID=2771008 RepID=A0A8J6Z954_9RHOB|nr:PAS-domain containing protein [Mangrovicoccus algicola]MBE3638216.1 PAS-domain containing protein [Mangrovicoccus algicola]